MHVVCAERLEQAQDLHVLAPPRPARACLHQPAKRRERIGQLPSGERRCLVQRSDLALNEGQIVERVEDHVLAFVGAWVAGDDLGVAADHHSVDVAAHPHLPIPVGDGDGVVVVVVAHQGLRTHLARGLMTGIERRARQRGHRLEVALQALRDALSVPAQHVALSLAAALLQIQVERLEARKARQRHHEVAP